jgi:CSLREA domain-containing protein
VTRVFIVALCAGWIACPDVAHADTFVVDTLADAVDAAPGDGVCAGSRGACTLRGAIMEANHLPGPDRIELPAATYRVVLVGDGEVGGDLVITDDLELVGEGRGLTVIDGNGNHRVLRVEASLDTTGLTIRNGDADGEDGGCVLATAPTSWVDVAWNDCTALDGGALWSSAPVDITQGRIHNAVASAAGGALWLGDAAALREVSIVGAVAEDSAVIAHTPSDPTVLLQLEQVRVHASEATDRFGEGIHSSGTLDADAVHISNNAFYTALNVEGDANIVALRIVGSSTGGVALWVTGDATVTHALFADVDDGIFLSGDGRQHLLTDIVAANITDASVHITGADTVSVDGLHSDLSSYGLLIGSDGVMTVVDATLRDISISRTTDGSMSLGGGRFDVEGLTLDRGETAALFNGTFALRDLQVSGHDGRDAALDIDDDAVVTIEDSTFAFNQNVDCWYCYTDYGGALENRGDTTLVRTTFVANVANTGGGAIWNTGTLTVLDSLFDSNAAESGGAIYNDAPGGVVVDSTTFTGNEAIEGGAMYFAGGELLMERSALVHNRPYTDVYQGDGGAIAGHLDGEIRNSTLAGNLTTRNGGALALEGVGDLLLDAVTIAFNRADVDEGYGPGEGAIWLGDDQRVRLRGTLVGANLGGGGSRTQCVVDGTGRLVSEGDNLVEVDCGGVFAGSGADLFGSLGAPLDPRLWPPDAGAGPTPVVALLWDSPALDAAATCPPADQWGAPRPADGDGDGTLACDIGAWERP